MYSEYNETNDLVRQGHNKNLLVADTFEFGGYVTDENGNFVGGSKWVYDLYNKHEKKNLV